MHARNSPNLAIIAVCARPYVTAAAQAGYKTAAFDIFNDVETRRFSLVSRQVDFRDGGFDPDDLWNKLTATIPEDVPVTLGSGLEGQPELLKKIAGRFPLLGNTADQLALVKQPSLFFSLLDELSIPHPEVGFAPPIGTGWLGKKSGGSGGTHIRLRPEEGSDYWQRYVEGVPVSVLFLADGRHTQVVGYNEQWLAPAPDMPFRYGGIVGNASLPGEAQAAMAEAADKIVRRTGLRGLNSMDFILSADGTPLALEVNPRLSASFDLYDGPSIFDWHLRCCRGERPPFMERKRAAKAALVYYAPFDLALGNTNWPSWTTDRPITGSRCRSGEPVCTIIAEGEDAFSAKALVFARACELDAQLRTLSIPPGK